MVFDPARSNLSQTLRLHYAIAASASQNGSNSYIAAVFAQSGDAARLIVAAFAVRPPMELQRTGPLTRPAHCDINAATNGAHGA